MDVRFAKSAQKTVTIDIHRHDGTTDRWEIRLTGPLPDAAVHFVLERALHMRRAFWGHVAAGATVREVLALMNHFAHPADGLSAEPPSAMVQLVQAERLAECFGAELKGPPDARASFHDRIDRACARSRVPPVFATDLDLALVSAKLRYLAKLWESLEIGGSVALAWR